MSDVPSSNTQAASAAPATPAAPTAEELQARLAELERQSEGRLRDLQEERRKRQELEQRLSPPAPSAAQPDVQDDEVAKIVAPHIRRHVEPLAQELESLRLEKAQNYLVQKTGKNWDSIENDRAFQDKMLQVVKKYGVSGNIYDKTVRAYELMELETLREKEAERARAAQVAQNTSLPSGAPPAPVTNQTSFSAEEFNRMPISTFDAMSKEGKFLKQADGSFVHVKNA